MILILFILGIAVAIAFYLIQSAGSERKLVVDVIDVVDGQTLEVKRDDLTYRVILSGIGFPIGDQKSQTDTFEIVKDICLGKKLYMIINKEADSVKYVNLLSGGGESLNELILKKGFARYESAGVGYLTNLVAAESEAKMKKVGIWDENRDIFNRASDSNNLADHLSDALHDADVYNEER
ncbi:thermonuclease family protein [Puniceicoccaceae bacterium K14]|nr:thermonuclease family protein [Puniceicoccaceae bacterium K14]